MRAEEFYFTPIIVFIDDMDKFEEKKINKSRSIKNACMIG